MATTKSWDDKNSSLVKDYDYWHTIYIPRRWEMIDFFVTLKNFYQPHAPRLMDVGGGTGAVAHRFLLDDGDVKVTLVDGSRPMLDKARERLSGFDVKFLYTNLNEKLWFTGAAKGYAVITSNIMIHHLVDPRKKEVFRDIYNLLDENGLFIYGDVIKFDDDDQEDQAYELWTHEIRNNFVANGEPLRDFDFMKHKLIENCRAEGDLPSSIEFIQESLRGVGFRRVSLVWFYVKFAIFVGIK